MIKYKDVDWKNQTDKFVACIDPGWERPAIYQKTGEFIPNVQTGYQLVMYNIPTESEAVQKCKEMNES